MPKTLVLEVTRDERQVEQGNGIGKRKIITAVRRCAPSSRANCFDHIVGVKICGFALLKNQCVIW